MSDIIKLTTKKGMNDLYDKFYTIADLYSTTCCRSCKLLSKKGCTVKNLGCKIFRCSFIKKKYPALGELLFQMQEMLRPSGIRLSYYDTKKTIMRRSTGGSY